MTRAQSLALVAALVASPVILMRAHVCAQEADTSQGVLGPGLYIFQTRIDHATCGDADRTGDVTSYYAAVDGIPGSRAMRMTLLNSTFWPRWDLSISDTNHLIGESHQEGVTGPHRGESHFELTQQDARFTGRGSRVYSRTVDGQVTRCRVSFDALLKRIDR